MFSPWFFNNFRPQDVLLKRLKIGGFQGMLPIDVEELVASLCDAEGDGFWQKSLVDP